MLNNKIITKKMKNIYLITLLLILISIITLLFMLKYNVEGEKNMPFNLVKINVISTAVGGKSLANEDGKWTNPLLQTNNVYFYIEKSFNYKKENIIKNINFNNFVFIKNDENNDLKIYRPSKNNNSYDYNEEFIVSDNLQYVGAKTTDTELLQINNQGGIIGFSVVNNNIAKYSIGENEEIIVDGKLLQQLGVKLEDIKFQLSFDMIIETTSGNKFKSNITLNLPTGDIYENGVSSMDNAVKNIVFKRCD